MKSFLLKKILFAVSFIVFFNQNSPGQEIDISTLPSYVHPPVLHPVPDGVKQEIPKIPGNQKYASFGIVDVTAAPFHADPAGKKDSTKALQSAIDFARDNQMVCFFPSGTYLISDTLICRQGMYLRSHREAVFNFDLMPCFLMGSRLGEGSPSYKRPQIVLAPNSGGFDDPGKKKYLLDYIIYYVKDKHDINSIDTSPASYSKAYNAVINAAFMNIDIEIGKGNSGAVGIRFNAAEGSVLQDVNIDATYGYIGIDGAAGNGGNWAHVTVTGGDIGLDMTEYSVPTPVMAGIILIGQRNIIEM
ncbi:MAG: hypothetical protein JXB88_24925 [Spirochaetales bacterium]|nr:hypothetical protein [Spirochaetales bacterium]